MASLNRVEDEAFVLASTISTWNNEFFQIVASESTEEEKFRLLKHLLLARSRYIDVSFQNREYVSATIYVLLNLTSCPIFLTVYYGY